MNGLLTLAIVIYSIVCLLLILIVLIQGGKAEGLFASAQSNVLGSQSGNVLSRATTILSTIFIVGALLISMAISSQRTAFERVGTTTQQAPVNTETAPIDNNTIPPLSN